MNHFQETADLIESAFRTFSEPGEDNVLAAQLKIGAAQAIATLALGQEVRAVALLLASTATPAGMPGVNPEITRTAYEAAVTHLGLVDPPEPDAMDIETLRALLLDDDAADKPVDQ